jgi:hypothetical protein
MTARASSRETASQVSRAQASLLRIDGEKFITSPTEKQSTIYPLLTTLSNGFATCSISAPSAKESRGEAFEVCHRLSSGVHGGGDHEGTTDAVVTP